MNPPAVSAANSALITFCLYVGVVFVLAWMANRLLRTKSFLSEYFLGSRSLGMWAFALTFAATSASGGSFTGFPSLIYTRGWVLALWISSYMVFPICTMGILGKRINQVARISGAITVPDVVRDRFGSARIGLLAMSLIVFFMSFNLIGQFKAGSEILNTLLRDVFLFRRSVETVAALQMHVPMLDGVDPAYLLCLLVFAVAVIIYTTWGGFHAVVWTDVMQGFVMVGGVCIMLPLAISQVGGLSNATQRLARMTPPRVGLATFDFGDPPAANHGFTGVWFTLPGEDPSLPRLFRINRTLTIPAGQSVVENVKVVEITTPEEIEQQLERLRSPESTARFRQQISRLKSLQKVRLESEQTEESARGVSRLETDMQRLDEVEAALLNTPQLNVADVEITLLREYRFGAGREGVYVTGPGPDPPQLPAAAAGAPTEALPESAGFLPLSLAFSFFFMWAISGTGQPSNMVRLMAFKDSQTLRRAMFTVSIYFTLIYIPLVIIFCCARVLLPGMDLESDRIMPQMTITLTSNVGQNWLAGLLVAAPFAAVMSTVDSFLLMISSSLVRDLYQRNINPDVSERSIKRMSYACTLLVGIAALIGAINPPQFLQDIIVYTTSGLAAAFLAPMVYSLYWKRTNATGVIAGMLGGFLAHVSLYFAGIFVNDSFYKPWRPLNFDPLIFGLFASFVAVYVVSKLTAPPPEELVRKYFYRRKASAGDQRLPV